jgi:hypothetical protein
LARDASFESRAGLNDMLVPYIVMNWPVNREFADLQA